MRAYRLLEPFQLGPITLKNRIVLPPMGTFLVSTDGSTNKRLIDYYTRYARGGAGMVIPEGLHIDDKESAVLGLGLSIHNDRFLPGLNDLAESVRDQGAAIIAQLAHAGHQTKPENIHGLQPVAPSPIANPFIGVVPKELGHEKIAEIQDSFADCAVRALTAGFDGVEIHGAGGYLLTQFLSPRFNVRTDKYGGSVENRARMALEILERIRTRTPPGFVVGIRVCADERVPGGISSEEMIAFVKMLDKAGIDYISVTSATYENMIFGVPPMYLPRGSNLHLSEMIKREVTVPVICAGGLDVNVGEQAIRDGKVDLVAIGRGLIADPELPLKLMENRAEDIRPCIRGNEGCMSRTLKNLSLSCEVNPGIGRDVTGAIAPAEIPKKILVIGGGAAGMEAARLSAERGHRVVLMEKQPALGGHLLEASAPEFKQDLRVLLSWLVTQLNKKGVEIRAGVEATPGLVKDERPDVLIIAAGSDYILPPELARDAGRFLLPDEVLLGTRDLGDRVVIAGGGFIGCETALFVAETLKKEVLIIEMLDDILLDCEEPVTMMTLRMKLEMAGVDVQTGLTVNGYSNNRISCTDAAGETHEMNADSLVLALGLRARKAIVEEFEGLAPEMFEVGDCVQPRKIYHAFLTARKAVFSF